MNIVKRSALLATAAALPLALTGAAYADHSAGSDRPAGGANDAEQTFADDAEYVFGDN